MKRICASIILGVGAALATAVYGPSCFLIGLVIAAGVHTAIGAIREGRL